MNLGQKSKRYVFNVFLKSYLQRRKLMTFRLPQEGRWGGLLQNFKWEGTSYYISLERSFRDKNFYKSCFRVRLLLKELQGASESIVSHLYSCVRILEICVKKCLINLIGRDSGGLWLKKKILLGDIRGTEELLEATILKYLLERKLL